jgi:hypothetical protein
MDDLRGLRLSVPGSLSDGIFEQRDAVAEIMVAANIQHDGRVAQFLSESLRIINP